MPSARDGEQSGRPAPELEPVAAANRLEVIYTGRISVDASIAGEEPTGGMVEAWKATCPCEEMAVTLGEMCSDGK
jgi:hypothetical protein